MRAIIPFITGCLLITSCNRITKKAEEVASSTSSEVGKAVGKTSTEFVNGVKDGVDKAYDCTVTVSPELKSAGVEIGKFIINEDTNSHNKNRLSVYVIAGKPLNQTITAKVIDPKNREYGRVSVKIRANSGEASFFDFIFDKRTDIEGRSKIELK